MTLAILNDAVNSRCCPVEDGTTKATLPTLVFASPQASCCSGTAEGINSAFVPTAILNSAKPADALASATFQIEGVCSCEGHVVEKRLKFLKGVRVFTLNPITNQLKLTYDPAVVSIPDIQAEVRKAGASAAPLCPKADGDGVHSQSARRPGEGGCCG
jgi:hypothetical protein